MAGPPLLLILRGHGGRGRCRSGLARLLLLLLAFLFELSLALLERVIGFGHDAFRLRQGRWACGGTPLLSPGLVGRIDPAMVAHRTALAVLAAGSVHQCAQPLVGV